MSGTHLQKLARALAARSGLPYQRAHTAVLAAHRSGLLPPLSTPRGRERALERLTAESAGAAEPEWGDAPVALPWPAPSRTGSAAVVGREHSADHAARALRSEHAEFADRLGELGGIPAPTGPARPEPFGPEPVRQVRRVFLAKFNPAQADAQRGRFLVSDPVTEPGLWDLAGPADCWISDDVGQTRHTPAHEDIAPGDLVVVFRSEPRLDGQPWPDPDPRFGGRPHLVGVWWVTRVHRRRLLRGGRPAVVTEVYHRPLSGFADNPVDVRLLRAHDPALDRIEAFTDRGRRGLIGLRPAEAGALAFACSLPSRVLTAPDPVALARSLVGVRTGARADHAAYRVANQARYRLAHAAERAAVARVAADLVADGWCVFRREHVPRWGADLDCERPRAGGRLDVLAVEVKGTRLASSGGVSLQRSQYERAVRHALGQEYGDWVLAICVRALHHPPPPVQVWRAERVRREWDPARVR